MHFPPRIADHLDAILAERPDPVGDLLGKAVERRLRDFVDGGPAQSSCPREDVSSGRGYLAHESRMPISGQLSQVSWARRITRPLSARALLLAMPGPRCRQLCSGAACSQNVGSWTTSKSQPARIAAPDVADRREPGHAGLLHRAIGVAALHRIDGVIQVDPRAILQEILADFVGGRPRALLLLGPCPPASARASADPAPETKAKPPSAEPIPARKSLRLTSSGMITSNEFGRSLCLLDVPMILAGETPQ